MDETTSNEDPGTGPYRIVIAGRAGDRALRPLVDDFRVERASQRTTLRGHVRDPAHLHGVLARLTAMGLSIISVMPDRAAGEPRD